jgi:hypothetical protein
MTDLESKDALILHLERTLKLERSTRRDEFAKVAMMGLLSHSGVAEKHEVLAKEAYLIADAMEKERMK